MTNSDTIKASDILSHQSHTAIWYQVRRFNAPSSFYSAHNSTPNQASSLHSFRLFSQRQNILHSLLGTPSSTVAKTKSQTAQISIVCARTHQKITSDTNVKRKCRSAQRDTAPVRGDSVGWSNIFRTDQRKQENESKRINVSLSQRLKNPRHVRLINLGKGFNHTIRLWWDLSRVSSLRLPLRSSKSEAGRSVSDEAIYTTSSQRRGTGLLAIGN